MPGKMVRQPQEQGTESEPKAADPTKRTKQNTSGPDSRGGVAVESGRGLRERARGHPERSGRGRRERQPEGIQNNAVSIYRLPFVWLVHYTTLWRQHYRGFPQTLSMQTELCAFSPRACRERSPMASRTDLLVTTYLGYSNARHRTHICAGAILQFKTRR